MKITKEMIEDSVRFANFCQSVKLRWWNEGKQHIAESVLDELLLMAWEDFKADLAPLSRG